MYSILVLILAVCGTQAQIELNLDESLFDDISTEYESTTPAPTTVAPTSSKCTVGAMAGACVQSPVYCKTPNTGADAFTWRSTNPCRTGFCCKLSDVIPATTGTTPRTTSTTARRIRTSARPAITTARPARTTARTTPASPIINSLSPTPSGTQTKEGCGWRNPQGVGGQALTGSDGEANFGEFPWIVIIFKGVPVNQDEPAGQKLNIFSGGGSLIHRKVVLTTAHYVVNNKYLSIRAGEWDTQSTDEIYPHQDRDVEKIEIHKDFIKRILFYDVALLFLNKPVDPAPNIGVACLPAPKQLQQEGTRCFTSGWGKDKFGKGGQFQSVLKKVELPVVKHRTCQNLLRTTKLGNIFELHRSFMCAGGEPGIDTCKGDGGSPLVCPMEFDPDRFLQAGVTSWGIGCGDDGIPGVYVDVAVVRDWIDNKMAGNGYGNEMVYADY